MVTTNISISLGEMLSIIRKDPATVTKLASIWTRSFDKEALTVSMSYESTLMISPAW